MSQVIVGSNPAVIGKKKMILMKKALIQPSEEENVLKLVWKMEASQGLS